MNTTTAEKETSRPEIGAVQNTGSLIPTGELAIAKKSSNEELISEEKTLIETEIAAEGWFHGIRSYVRLFQVSRVIAMLSLYLYLDQYDIHRKHDRKRAETRLAKAHELTRAAVYGEKLYGVRLWFFDVTVRLLRRFLIGNNLNKEINQEKQAVWLKEKLIKLGPTFIKIGQSI